jgi:hypothetical protein
MGHIFKANRVNIFGIQFDSKDESDRYLELRQQQLFGEIKELKCHPEFELRWNGELIKNYTADFSYTIVATGEYVVEDVKSQSVKMYPGKDGESIKRKFGTANEREWILTRKMMKAAYGIEVREVLMNRSLRSMIKNNYNR